MISSSLRTGSPLPQITPCPLLDRFLLQYHGLNVIHKEAGEDYGLPRSMTFDTLKNEQYLYVDFFSFSFLHSRVNLTFKFYFFYYSMFCVGITTAFGIINRLDQLMLAAKEVVGEHYHIHGVGGGRGGGRGASGANSANPQATTAAFLKEGIRPFATQFQPPEGDVV